MSRRAEELGAAPQDQRETAPSASLHGSSRAAFEMMLTKANRVRESMNVGDWVQIQENYPQSKLPDVIYQTFPCKSVTSTLLAQYESDAPCI